MSLHKHWTPAGDKEIIRNHDEAEWQRTAHEGGECLEDCMHCRDADFDAQCQRYSFDRLHEAFVASFKKGLGR